MYLLRKNTSCVRLRLLYDYSIHALKLSRKCIYDCVITKVITQVIYASDGILTQMFLARDGIFTQPDEDLYYYTHFVRKLQFV